MGDSPLEGDFPLPDEERDLLRQDLDDVGTLKHLLDPRGIKGAVFYCPDCDEDHYLTWDLLKGNLEELLQQGESPVHEPAFEPNPDDYVSWDYARGFLDGFESYEQEELGEVAMTLVLALRDRGWKPEEVRSLLNATGLEVPPHPAASEPEGDERP